MEEKLEIVDTQFNRDELKRITDLIHQTDPRSREYAQLLECIERFIYFANVVAAAQDFAENGNGTHDLVQFTPPTSEAEKFPEQIEEEPDEPTEEYDPAEVKKLITRARAEKKIDSVKDWILTNCGVEGFSAIPAKMYPDVVAKLKELGVS